MSRRNRASAKARKNEPITSEREAKRPSQCARADMLLKENAKTTDRNDFDTYLKQALHRDILFRIAAWSVIAAATAIFATAEKGYDAIVYLAASAHKLIPLINTIGSVALLLSLFALLLKEFDHVAPERWGPKTCASWWGGAIRRLAGDLTLWLLDTFVAFFFAMVGATSYAIFMEHISLREGIALVIAYTVVLIFIVLIGGVNIFVRREAPPLAGTLPFSRWMRSPKCVLVVYAALLAAAVLMLYVTRRIGP